MADAVTDPAYLIDALLSVGVDDVLSALSDTERGTGRQANDAATLGVILRRQTGALRLARVRRDKTLLVQQLVYEAATIGATDLGRRFAGHLPDAGLLTLWATIDTPLRQLTGGVKGHRSEVTSVVVTGDGTRGFTTSKDRATQVWRLSSGRLAHTQRAGTTVSNMYAECDGPHVVASTTDGRAQLWDADTGTVVAEATARKTTMVTAFAVNGGGTIGLGGDLDGRTTVWDLTSGEPITRLPSTAGLVTAVAITPDASTAATATTAGGVTIWDLKTGTPAARLPGSKAANALALSPTADRVLVGGCGLAMYALTERDSPRLAARLMTVYDVTAVAINPAMPMYAMFGGAYGQVGYVRLPAA